MKHIEALHKGNGSWDRRIRIQLSNIQDSQQNLVIDCIWDLERHDRSVGYELLIHSLNIKGALIDYTVKCSHFYP